MGDPPGTEVDEAVYLFPTSFAQRRLWFLDRITRNAELYSVTLALRADAPLSPNGIRVALDGVVARHEILRTTFVTLEGEPVQRVADSGRIAIERISDPAAFCSVPFDLARGPLLRAGITRDGQVLLRMHHIITDGWSVDVLLGEIAELYRSWELGRRSALAELPIQYADFAIWQRAELSGEGLEKLLGFWRTELADAPALELVTDRPRPPDPTFRGGSVPLRVTVETLTGLRAVAQRERATLFMTVLAGFAVLLARYSAQNDVLIGTPVAGRDRRELESLIGFFVNTVVIRCRLDGDPSFADLVRRVREHAVASFAHQDLPFEKLVDEIETVRDAGRNPLVQVLFQLVTRTVGNATEPTVRPAAGNDAVGGFRWGAVDRDDRTSKFDLGVTLWDTAQGLAGRFDYATDLFDHATVERMAVRFTALLGSLAADPDLPLSRLPLAGSDSSADRAPTTPPAPDVTVPDLVLAQARRTPERPAVGDFDYRGLVRAACGLADHLIGMGVGPGALVGLALPRGPAAVVALFGIWWAGAAFVPLDPDDPPVRRQEIVDAARPVVVIDETFQFPEGRDGAPPASIVRPDLAYVLFTSGTTGPPKGVLIEHGALANFLGWFVRTFPGPLPWLTRLSFDASLKQVLGPLVSGGRVWIPGPEAVLDPAVLLAELSGASGIILNCAPAQWAGCLAAIDAGRAPVPPPERIRTLLLGGDRLSAELAERTRRRFPGLDLWNGYGPTETTSMACAGRVESGRPVTIGGPIDGVRVLVVDALGSPAPQDVPGELWIGGPGVGRGYLGRPEETAERFVERDGTRWYRSGDLVVPRRDGLEFRGRIDEQLNLAGIRVEPFDVERHLLDHPGVTGAAVAIRDGRLVGYLVGEPDLPTLRVHLRDRLPPSLVPSRLVQLADLPRTGTGKLDRKALPEPPRPRSTGRAAEGHLERDIAAIWQEVLGIDRVGSHDNFFDLGGHSLLLVAVHERLTVRLGRQLSILDLFQRPTVQALASHLSRS